jgi:class 3 adenylate cyclase
MRNTPTVVNAQTDIRTFLIADIRGYSRFTEDHGDEAAAKLARKFADLVAEEVQAHGGELIELRGDEALSVFTSARQAIRAAVDLQALFEEETQGEPDLPLTVGIGLDSGEAVRLPDGSFRGAALNVAARLCGRAHGGEVLVTEATSRLAGRLSGLHYSDRGRLHLKNIPDPVHVMRVYSELEAPPPRDWVVMFFGKRRRGLGWKVALAAVPIAALTAAAVVYLTSGDHGDQSQAAPGTTTDVGGGGLPSNRPLAANASLDRLVPAAIWRDCTPQAVPQPNASQTAVCLPGNGVPARWEISAYPDGATLRDAYNAELRRHTGVERGKGTCNVFFWGGEYEWLHGPGKPGGRALCYFDGDDAVIIWTHERLGQPTHRDVLVTARQPGADHATLTRWWRPWHHLIGKAE